MATALFWPAESDRVGDRYYRHDKQFRHSNEQLYGHDSATSTTVSGPINVSSGNVATFANNAASVLTVSSSLLSFAAGASSNTVTFNGSGLGATNFSAPILFNAAATINDNVSGANAVGATTLSGVIYLAGATTVSNTSATMLTVGNITANGNQITISGGGNQTYNGIIADGAGGSGSLNITGTGTYFFTGASTFTGGVLLSNNNASTSVIATVAGGFGGNGSMVTFSVPNASFELRATAITYTAGVNTTNFSGTVIIDPPRGLSASYKR